MWDAGKGCGGGRGMVWLKRADKGPMYARACRSIEGTDARGYGGTVMLGV